MQQEKPSKKPTFVLKRTKVKGQEQVSGLPEQTLDEWLKTLPPGGKLRLINFSEDLPNMTHLRTLPAVCSIPLQSPIKKG